MGEQIDGFPTQAALLDNWEIQVVTGFRRWGELHFLALPTIVGAGWRAATHAAHWAPRQQGRPWGQIHFRAARDGCSGDASQETPSVWRPSRLRFQARAFLE